MEFISFSFLTIENIDNVLSILKNLKNFTVQKLNIENLTAGYSISGFIKSSMNDSVSIVESIRFNSMMIITKSFTENPFYHGRVFKYKFSNNFNNFDINNVIKLCYVLKENSIKLKKLYSDGGLITFYVYKEEGDIDENKLNKLFKNFI